ncbi:MAG: cysteine hydrolase family protein [Corticimicrobacter sp.]|uniref:cysteine hydrolase family protein n=1 Tax=Corticimicrobacter sp. TaxID=2678536 RepID=UPI0032DB9270
MTDPRHALIVIDLQNDYFPEGRFPLWNTLPVLDKTIDAIKLASSRNIPVILVQHIAPSQSPFFSEGTTGADLHPRLLAAAPKAPVVIKTQADSFLGTSLTETLEVLKVDSLLICGMMTHNCVTHTALSKAAEKYQLAILQDCCATVSEILHVIALKAIEPRIPLLSSEQALGTASR